MGQTMIEDLALDELERTIVSLYGVPGAIIGVPEARSFTTPYADMLDAIGEPNAAAEERTRACREARERLGIDHGERSAMVFV